MRCALVFAVSRAAGGSKVCKSLSDIILLSCSKLMLELPEIALSDIRGAGHYSSCFIRLLADSVSLAPSIALYTFKRFLYHQS